MVIFGKSGSNRAILVVFFKKWFLYRAKMVLLRHDWLYSGIVVVFGKTCCIRESDFTRKKFVVIGQKWLYSYKIVVFGQKWLYSGKVVVLGQ